MMIGDRLRALREVKGFSQGEIEKRAGLARSYISRVENGHGVPAIETLEKFVRALEVPLYQLFYDGKKPPERLPLANRADVISAEGFGSTRKEAIIMTRLEKLLAQMSERDRRVLLHLAQKMAIRAR